MTVEDALKDPYFIGLIVLIAIGYYWLAIEKFRENAKYGGKWYKG